MTNEGVGDQRMRRALLPTSASLHRRRCGSWQGCGRLMEHVCPDVSSSHHRATRARKRVSSFPRPAPSPLVTAAPRLVLRSPTSSSPWAPRNLRVLGSPAATPPLLLRPPHCPAASLPFLSASPSYPMFLSLPRATAGGGNPSIRAGFSPRRTSTGRAAGPSRCSAR